MSSDEAIRSIANLVMAAQGFDRPKPLRDCIRDLFFDLTGEEPSADDLEAMGAP